MKLEFYRQQEKSNESYTGEALQGYQLNSLHIFFRPEGTGMIYPNCEKGKTFKLGYSTQQDYNLEYKER